MGTTLFKPKKIPIEDDFPINVNINSNSGENSNINLRDHLNEILIVVRQLVATYENFYNDDIEKNLSSRAVNRKRPIEKNDDIHIQQKYPRYENLKEILKVFSMNELIEYLDRCSNSTESPGRSDDLEIEPTVNSVNEIVKNGSLCQIQKLSQSELEPLLKIDKIHLDLASNTDSTERLIAVLDMAATFYILDDILKLKNEKNNIIAIAFLNSNIRGFFCLLKKFRAKIPMYFYKEGHKFNFLNYIGQHGKLSKVPSGIDYLLVHVLNIIKEEYSSDKIEKYLYDTDAEGLNLSLPHLLLHMYQDSVDLRTHITECLKICLEACPSCIEILCVSKYCTAYKFDLIAHAIILPETNFDIIKMFMKLKLSDTEKRAYTDLINVHEKSIQRKILKIFDM